MKLYKFLRTGLKSDNGKNRDWKIGEWRHEDEIDICNKGFHASKAWSAAAAARSAARSAAAESAAESAESAEAAARSAARSSRKKLTASIDKWFLKRIKTLEPYE